MCLLLYGQGTDQTLAPCNWELMVELGDERVKAFATPIPQDSTFEFFCNGRIKGTYHKESVTCNITKGAQ